MSVPTREAPLAFDEPDGLSPRGTVLILAGRGEGAEVYRRLGTRLAADGYRVRVLPDEDVDGGRVAEILEGAVEPRVLAGADVGALRTARIAQGDAVAVQGIILVGLPVATTGQPASDWQAELEVRTACPVHRARLSEGIVRAGELSTEISEDLLEPPSGFAAPALVIHGDVDQVSSVAQAADWLSAVDDLELVTIAGGRHDALNDVTHRSVAAIIVLWLERLRGGPILEPVVTIGGRPR